MFASPSDVVSRLSQLENAKLWLTRHRTRPAGSLVAAVMLGSTDPDDEGGGRPAIALWRWPVDAVGYGHHDASGRAGGRRSVPPEMWRQNSSRDVSDPRSGLRSGSRSRPEGRSRPGRPCVCQRAGGVQARRHARMHTDGCRRVPRAAATSRTVDLQTQTASLSVAQWPRCATCPTQHASSVATAASTVRGRPPRLGRYWPGLSRSALWIDTAAVRRRVAGRAWQRHVGSEGAAVTAIIPCALTPRIFGSRW